jgi:hypothetical protein
VNKTIWITGDSFGLPNLFSDNVSLETILASKGYNVMNFSIGGTGNSIAFENVNKHFEQKKTSPDILIWFHTELAREWGENQTQWTYQKRLNDTAAQVYTRVHEIVKKLNTKLIVIEGQSVVAEPYFSDLFQPDAIIKDWRSEILGEKMPESHIISRPYLFLDNSCINTDEEKNKLINDITFIWDKMVASEDYPDGCHPSKKQYLLLGERIEACIKKLI